MANALEGGNQPKRVLLLGGPKHGDYMNLPADDAAYTVIESQAGLAYHVGSTLPGHHESTYVQLHPLTRTANKAIVFIHESITKPGHHRDAEVAKQAEERLAAEREDKRKLVLEKQEILDDLTESETAAQKAEAALEEIDAREIVIRRHLEMVLQGASAIASFLPSYAPMLEPRDA